MKIFTIIMVLMVAIERLATLEWTIFLRSKVGDSWRGDVAHTIALFALAVPLMLIAGRYTPHVTLRRTAARIIYAAMSAEALYILYYFIIVRGSKLNTMDVWISVGIMLFGIVLSALTVLVAYLLAKGIKTLMKREKITTVQS